MIEPFQELYQIISSGRIEEAHLKIKDLLESNFSKHLCNMYKVILHNMKGEYTTSLEIASMEYNNHQTFENPNKFITGSMLATTQWYSGDTNKAFELLLEIESLYHSFNEQTQSELKFWFGILINTKGGLYWSKNDLKSSFECIEESYRIRESINDQLGMAVSLNNYGAIYNYRGDLQKAREYYERSLEIYNKLDNQMNIAFTGGNLAIVYQEHGDLETAFSIYQRSKEIVVRFGHSNYYGRILDNLGVLYSMMGDYQNAQLNLEESLSVRSKLGNLNDICETLLDIILVNINFENVEKSEEYLEYFADLISNNPNHSGIEIYNNLAKALILTKKASLKNFLKAKNILEIISKNSDVYFKLRYIAILTLCEILIFEWELFQDQEILKTIDTNLEEIEKFALSQQNNPFLIEYKIFKSKIILLNGDYENSIKELDHALELSNESNLQFLIDKTKSEQMILLQKLKKYESLAKDSNLLPGMNMASEIKVLDYLNSIKGIISRK